MLLTDHALTEQVQNVLFLHPHLRQRSVRMTTENGNVTIQGSVNSYFEKQMAQEALRNIQGIKTIENQLEVHWVEVN